MNYSQELPHTHLSGYEKQEKTRIDNSVQNPELLQGADGDVGCCTVKEFADPQKMSHKLSMWFFRDHSRRAPQKKVVH